MIVVKAVEHAIRLADGRIIEALEQGVCNGRAVLYLHGTPGSNKDHSHHDELYQQQDVRLISVNRPGTGNSTASSDWNALSFADDLEQLLDQLGIDRAIVVGYSAGGLYGCAFAHRYPKRVERLALLSSVGPFDIPQVGDKRGETTKTFHNTARDNPAALLDQFSAVSSPEALLALIDSVSSPEDQKVSAQPEIASQLLLSYRDAMAQGLDKFINEIALINTPWGFSPGEITTKTLIWHGTADINIPIECSQYLAEQIPSSQAIYIEGAGHLFSLEQWPELLQAIIAD